MILIIALLYAYYLQKLTFGNFVEMTQKSGNRIFGTIEALFNKESEKDGAAWRIVGQQVVKEKYSFQFRRT